MSNKNMTAVEWLVDQLECFSNKHELQMSWDTVDELLNQAKAMEKQERGYTKEDVLTAGEMGEINTYDTKHIVSYLDEAKQFNETFGGK